MYFPLVRLCLASAVFVFFSYSSLARSETDSLVKKGEYLVHAANCASCHTRPGGEPFSGGVAFYFPKIGKIYSPNITPDKKTGIGNYTQAEFISALQKGVGHGGKRLYPVMPYTSYSLVRREDIVAIKAYLDQLPPVRSHLPPNDVAFPYNLRSLMIFWNFFQHSSAGFQADPSRTAAWNRGKYLVEALGHCAECHSPRNFMGGRAAAKAYSGGQVAGWEAYNISSDVQSGIGAWSNEDLEAYLSSGHADGHGTAIGPMGAIVANGLRYLDKKDIHAMVLYLRSLPAQKAGKGATGMEPERLALAEPRRSHGARLFFGACDSCHLYNGQGRHTPMAAMWGARVVSMPDGHNLIQVLLRGARLPSEEGMTFMPSFEHGYTDQDIADIANYVISHYGDRTGRVTAQDVQMIRKQNGM